MNKNQSTDNTTRNNHYSSLDGLRAYAAVGIILMHVLSNISIKPSSNLLTKSAIPFFTDFTLLFMIISGFSMCCGYYEKIKNGTIKPNEFYKKRYLKILPFFGILCIFDLCISPSLESFYQVLGNLTLSFGLFPVYKMNVIGVGWFLGVVFLFYMLFPFYVFLLDNKRKALISFFISCILVYIGLYSNCVFGGISRSNIIFCAPFFISGGIIYLWKEKVSSLLRKHTYITNILVIFLSFLIFYAIGGGNPLLEYLYRLILFSIWLIYAITYTPFFLSNKPLKFISNISMEIYLCHMLIYRIIEKLQIEKMINQPNLSYIIISILTISGAICFSYIMKNYIIEKILNNKKKISGL